MFQITALLHGMPAHAGARARGAIGRTYYPTMKRLAPNAENSATNVPTCSAAITRLLITMGFVMLPTVTGVVSL